MTIKVPLRKSCTKDFVSDGQHVWNSSTPGEKQWRRFLLCKTRTQRVFLIRYAMNVKTVVRHSLLRRVALLCTAQQMLQRSYRQQEHQPLAKLPVVNNRYLHSARKLFTKREAISSSVLPSKNISSFKRTHSVKNLLHNIYLYTTK